MTSMVYPPSHDDESPPPSVGPILQVVLDGVHLLEKLAVVATCTTRVEATQYAPTGRQFYRI